MKRNALILAALSGLLTLGAARQASAKLSNDQQVVASVVFKPTSESRLTQYVYDTVDPTSANYHHYLSTTEFAQKFGQSQQYVDAFKRYLNQYHVHAYAYRGRLSLKVRGTRANVNQAFHAKAGHPKGQPSRTYYQLPKQLAHQVVTVIGLNALKSKQNPTPKRTDNRAVFSTLTRKAAGSDGPDTHLKGTAFSKKYGALKFAERYQLTNLYNKGLSGQNQRIGIIAFGDIHRSDLKTYWRQAGTNTDTSRVRKIYVIDNQKKVQASMTTDHVAEQSEATLDVESAGAVAPKAGIDFYTGTSVDNAVNLHTSLFTAFTQAISNNVDRQLSTSYSPHTDDLKLWEEHSATPSQYNHAFNLILEQAAAQGITVFNASGDRGPWEWSHKPLMECHGIPTSPYQVLVGGTTLPYSKVINGKRITVTKERAWGTLAGISADNLKAGAFLGGGGGFSALNPTPRYQQGVPGVNTFSAINLIKYLSDKKIYALNKHPRLITGVHEGRNLPDVAGNADERTGYATYLSCPVPAANKKAKPIIKKLWTIGGGTSYTAPQMAAANAIINSGKNTPVGFWNPQIYQFAQQADTPFNVLADNVDNNNLYYTGQPGKLYNQATGLGTINFDKLYQKFK